MHYFKKQYGHFEFDDSNTFQKSWDRAMFATLKHPLFF